MKNTVKWLGHATFEITTSKGTKIYLDPWFDKNPSNPFDLSEIEGADLILVTHDHFDHFSDAVALAEKSGAILVIQPEIAWNIIDQGFPKEQVVKESGMNIGGTVEISNIRITMVQAFHTSGLGSPAGFIIELEDGKIIYHAGDTGIFSSMELLGNLYPIDLALLPIGGCVTMDVYQAVKALELLKPKMAIPMHYGTFPKLVSDPEDFISLAREKLPDIDVAAIKPGENYLL